MKELLRRIDRLEKRVNELEANEHNPIAIRAASAAQQPAPPVQSQQPDTASALSAHEHIPSSELQQVETHYPSLQIRGFGDVDFSATDQKGSNSGFNLGQFVLHLASPLSGKVSYFGEVSFTAQPTTYDLSVERSIIRYDYNDYFKMSFGKYHTPDRILERRPSIMGPGCRRRSAGRKW